MDYLEESGKADDTIVIYSSDHGGYHGIHGIEEKAPGICSDAVCHIPMIWRVPGGGGADVVTDAFVEQVDIAATLPRLCGMDPMEFVDGRDLSALLSHPTSADPVRSCAVTENPYAKSIRWDNWRMVYYPDEMFDGDEYGELYDMAGEPDELNNLYYDADHREIRDEGMRKLMSWLITTSRIVTTQPALREDGKSGRDIHGPRNYPFGTDNTAPDWVQPRNRTDNNINYL